MNDSLMTLLSTHIFPHRMSQNSGVDNVAETWNSYHKQQIVSCTEEANLKFEILQ